MNWIHFIGKAYYTPESFIKEAQTFGVRRRASLNQLGGFSWGDRIFLAFGDFCSSRRKSEPRPSIVFGFVDISVVGGLSPEALRDLPSDTREIISTEESEISRGCGSYRVLAVFEMNWTIKRLAEFLRDGDSPYSVKPSVGGTFIAIPEPVEIGMGFRFGYTKVTPERVQAFGLEGLTPYLKTSQPEDSSVVLGEVIKDYHLNLWERTGF